MIYVALMFVAIQDVYNTYNGEAKSCYCNAHIY